MSRGSVSSKRFETKKKNGISLRNDELLDTHFKPLKIGNEVAPIELSKGKARFAGNLLIHKIEGDIDIADGDVNLSEGGKIRFDNDITSVSGEGIISSGNSYINVEDDVMYFYVGGEKLLTIGQASGLGSVDKITSFTSNLSIDEGQKLYFEGMDSDSYLHRTTGDILEYYGDGTKLFSITDTGSVTLHAGSLVFENEEYISNSTDGILSASGHLATAGDFILNQGNNIIFDGDADSHTYIEESDDDILDIYVGGVKALSITEESIQTISIPAEWKLLFDGGANTYIHEASADKMEIVVGGDEMITLDEANQRITLESSKLSYHIEGGTEYSVADSAYAGTILGYRMIGEDAIHATYTLTTSMVVPASAMAVRFIAPPSGSVEVMVQVMFDGTSNRALTVGLSDNATYNSLGNSYEQISGNVDVTEHYTHQHYWTVTGLTAGSTYNYWFGASANGGTLAWGGTGAGRYPDFIMKVTALPAAVSDFAEYD